MSVENGMRAAMLVESLPKPQQELAEAVAKAGKPLVILLRISRRFMLRAA